MRDCVKRIVEKSNGAISQQDAKDIITSIDSAVKRKVAEGFDYDQSVTDILKQRVEETKRNVMRQKANIARNLVIKKSGIDKLSRMVDAGLSPLDAIRADLEGIESPVEGARASIDVQKEAVSSAYFSKFIGELNDKNLLELFNSKQLDEEIGKELWAISEGKTATKNKQAKEIADAIHRTREAQRIRLNTAGADIGEAAGYIMPQRHDTYEMHRVGEDKWVSDIEPLLDKTRSFNGDYTSFEVALRSAYRAMITGVRLNDPTVDAPKLFQFSGPANLGKKLSQARLLHFKDYASWKQWNDTYGMKDLNEGVIDAIRMDANNIALMERYGTNPEAMMKELVTGVKEKYRNQLGAKFDDEKVNSMIDGVMGKNLIPADPKLAQIGSNIRVYQNTTKLGGALLASVTDMPMKALEYKFQGKSWLSSSVQPFMDIAEGFKSKKERVQFASLVGAGMEGIIGDVGARFSAQDSLSNKAAKVQRMYFKLNGLAWWTDTHKQAMGRVMAHHLGMMKDIPFTRLDADTKRLFGNYRISEADWDAMRTSAAKLEDGRDYILPASIKDAKLSEKLAGYYISRIDAGVVTPSAREQRLSTLGTRRGTAVGEAVRLIMQFKSFSITIGTKVFGRALYGKGKADIPAMTYLMLSSMTFGYLAGAMKDLVKGKTPKDPAKIETIYASLAQGGGLGIMGDILLNDSSFGRSFSSTLAGPTFGSLDDLFKIYSSSIRGEGAARQATMTAINAIPFNNLFYTRSALDQLILLQMQEDMNPGYLRRMENNMERTYGQELLFK